MHAALIASDCRRASARAADPQISSVLMKALATAIVGYWLGLSALTVSHLFFQGWPFLQPAPQADQPVDTELAPEIPSYTQPGRQDIEREDTIRRRVEEMTATSAKQHRLPVDELRCLQAGLYLEARGEGIVGLEGTASAVLYRLGTKPGRDTICGILAEPGAFPQLAQTGTVAAALDASGNPIVLANTKHTPAFDRSPLSSSVLQSDESAVEQTLDIAARALLGRVPDHTRCATSFYSTAILHSPPGWASSMVKTVRIGAHVFYRDPHVDCRTRAQELARQLRNLRAKARDQPHGHAHHATKRKG